MIQTVSKLLNGVWKDIKQSKEKVNSDYKKLKDIEKKGINQEDLEQWTEVVELGKKIKE